MPFGPMGSQECKWCVEIQRRKNFDQDEDVVLIELQMQCYKNKQKVINAIENQSSFKSRLARLISAYL